MAVGNLWSLSEDNEKDNLVPFWFNQSSSFNAGITRLILHFTLSIPSGLVPSLLSPVLGVFYFNI